MGHFYIENIIMCCLSRLELFFSLKLFVIAVQEKGTRKKKRNKSSREREREKVLGNAPCVRSQCPRNSTRSGCLRALCPIKTRRITFQKGLFAESAEAESDLLYF
jgi:hypothetical protein